SSPSAQTISVALGSREAIRISAGRHERVEQHLLLDRGAGAVPRIHHGLGWKRVEHVANAEDDLSHVAAGSIGAADAALKQGVSGKAIEAKEKAHRTLGLPRGVADAQPEARRRQRHP